jgi:hypothetical protein
VAAFSNLQVEFLDALEDRDLEALATASRRLRSCWNELPEWACRNLQIPPGSSFACGAGLVLCGRSTIDKARQTLWRNHIEERAAARAFLRAIPGRY